MALINYTETKLGRGYTLVSWANVTKDDSCQPFNMVGYEVVSFHGYRSSTGDLILYSILSNEPTPSNWVDGPGVASGPILIGSFTKAVWLSMRPEGTGAINASGYFLLKDTKC